MSQWSRQSLAKMISHLQVTHTANTGIHVASTHVLPLSWRKHSRSSTREARKWNKPLENSRMHHLKPSCSSLKTLGSPSTHTRSYMRQRRGHMKLPTRKKEPRSTSISTWKLQRMRKKKLICEKKKSLIAKVRTWATLRAKDRSDLLLLRRTLIQQIQMHLNQSRKSSWPKMKKRKTLLLTQRARLPSKPL